MKQQFELIFEIQPISEDLEEVLMSVEDAYVGGHGDTHLVTMTAAGVDAITAALDADKRLRTLGIVPLRLYPDVVDRGAIASRTGVTRQAVGNWVRGDRQMGFPAPFLLGRSEVWLWGEVREWLLENGNLVDDDGLGRPTRRDHTVVDYRLETRCGVRADFQAGALMTMTVSRPVRAEVSFGQWKPVMITTADERTASGV